MNSSTSLSFLARCRRSRSFMVGGVMTGFLLVCAAVSLFWTPGSAYDISIANRFLPPSSTHWLGTDQFGRDIVSMLMTGTQNSIAVAVVAVSIGLAVGVSLGLLAAARRGWTEELIMRFSDFSFAFPAILSAIMITAILGPGGVNSILAIGLYNIPVFARLVRGTANAIWTREFVMAARASGKDRFRITFEHIMPNILSIIIVQATILFAIAILAEAALSYLGLGTQPPHPSWGRMLNEAQALMFLDPWQAIYPGIAIATAVFGLNLLGDGLRDVLDPRLSRKR
ncbi:MAG: peptide ABC transporter permease [Sneathiella sp.]|nr:MAG: peptide ABC transporter permease [Sneathiella sp.]